MKVSIFLLHFTNYIFYDALEKQNIQKRETKTLMALDVLQQIDNVFSELFTPYLSCVHLLFILYFFSSMSSNPSLDMSTHPSYLIFSMSIKALFTHDCNVNAEEFD